MKHNLALIVLLTLAVYCSGQVRGQNTPPDDVNQTFYSNFPAAAKPDWEKRGAHYFVTFSQKGVNMIAKYTLTGNWVATDIPKVPLSLLPSTTTEYLNDNHPGYKVQTIFYHDSSVDKSHYRIKLQGGSKNLYFHDNGNFWKSGN